MFSLLADVPAPPRGLMQALDTPTLLLYGGAAVGVLLLLTALLLATRRGKKRVAPERGHDEDLSEYPPAPGGPGPRRLTAHGRPVRLRLVVLAPVGKQAVVEDGAVEALLDAVLHGLGQIARHDRPRIKVWPPQLSQQGFAPTFFRRTLCPDRPGQPSHWTLAAGPARAGGRPVLLGLAMWGDDKAAMEQQTLADREWNAALRIEGA